MVRSCSAFVCSNRDNKESRKGGLKFYHILVNVDKWQLGGGGLIPHFVCLYITRPQSLLYIDMCIISI